jgi:hypothetical protein
MHIEIDDLTRPAMHALLNEHLQHMRELSPPESVHALDLAKLRQPDITFWTSTARSRHAFGSACAAVLHRRFRPGT